MRDNAESPVVEATWGAASFTRTQLAITMTALMACVFVTALDITIISTALPAIVETFRSASAYQWAGSSYMLASSASTPIWGRLSDIWGRTPILFVAITAFFAGSLVCAIAPSLEVFIVGRAVQGVGCTGVTTMVNICICDLFSLRDRGLYLGLVAAVVGIAGALGPVLGGVFTEKLSWRWCFWINLPICAVTFVSLFYLRLPTPKMPLWEGLKAIDWVGSFLIVGSTLMILLGLNLGDVSHPWDSATVICLLVFGAVAGVLFVLNEFKLAKNPVLPPRLMSSRSTILPLSVVFFHAFVFMGTTYYLPLYFQAVALSGPMMSGVYCLPSILPMMIVAALTGVYMQRTGRFMPPMWFGLPLMTLGVSLFIDLPVTISWAKVIVYQLVVATGLGFNFEPPLLALQASLDASDMAAATAAFGFLRQLGMAIATVTGGVMVQNHMAKESPALETVLGPEMAHQIGGHDAAAHVGVISTLPMDQQLVVRGAFNRALRYVWIMYVVCSVLSFLASVGIPRRRLSTGDEPAGNGLSVNNQSKRHILDSSRESVAMTENV